MKEPWFKQGLKFKCTGCGKCCIGSEGYVFLSPQDLSTLADHFKITEQEFIDHYTRIIDGQPCLLDAPKTDRCIFLKNNQCAVYQSRPIQCQTFPWWLHHLKNKECWDSAANHCEGINHPDAPTIPGSKIAQECMKYMDNLVEQNSAFAYNHSKND